MENIVNSIEEGYTGRVEVSFSKQVSVDSKTPELFNGFSSGVDILPNLPIEHKMHGRKAIPELKYNYNDSALYVVVVYHFNAPLDEETLSKIKKYTDTTISGMVMNQNLGTVRHTVSMNNDNPSYLRQLDLEAPQGFVYLDSLLDSDMDSKMYQMFLNNELAFARLLVLCEKLGYNVTEEMITGIMLPVHRKHDLTGAILVHSEVERLFQMYKLVQNYITGFDEGTHEYALGITMAYDVKFNDYVLRCAVRQSEEGKDPDAVNFQKEYEKACKRINKSYPPMEDVKDAGSRIDTGLNVPYVEVDLQVDNNVKLK